MMVLIFNQPFVIIAQQNSVEVQAKRAAERDAEVDVNKLLWTSIGCVYTCSTICCVLGAELGNALSGVSGSSTSTGIDLDLASASISPRPERLIGKSPEYIEFYTDAYKKKVKQLREKSLKIGAVGAGCLIGCIVLLLVLDD